MRTILILSLLIISVDLNNGYAYKPTMLPGLSVRRVSFSSAFNLIRANEGGYVNHPLDRGGKTYCGITYRWNKKWQGWNTPLKYYFVKNFYYKMWRESGFDTLTNQQVADYLMDTRVSISRKKTIKLLNKCMGLNVKYTKRWVTPSLDSLSLEKLVKCRCEYYKKIVIKNPSQKVFLKGWLNRANRYGSKT